MDSRVNNSSVPAWLIAAVMAAGMTAYAEDCDRPIARPKAPVTSSHEDGDTRTSADSPALPA